MRTKFLYIGLAWIVFACLGLYSDQRQCEFYENPYSVAERFTSEYTMGLVGNTASEVVKGSIELPPKSDSPLATTIYDLSRAGDQILVSVGFQGRAANDVFVTTLGMSFDPTILSQWERLRRALGRTVPIPQRWKVREIIFDSNFPAREQQALTEMKSMSVDKIKSKMIAKTVEDPLTRVAIRKSIETGKMDQAHPLAQAALSFDDKGTPDELLAQQIKRIQSAADTWNTVSLIWKAESAVAQYKQTCKSILLESSIFGDNVLSLERQ